MLERTNFHASSTFFKPSTKRKGKGRGKCRHSTTATYMAKAKTATPSQIDYFVMDDRHKNTAVGCRVLWRQTQNRYGRKYDHGAMLMTLRIKLGRPKARAPKPDYGWLKETTPEGVHENRNEYDARLQVVAKSLRDGIASAAPTNSTGGTLLKPPPAKPGPGTGTTTTPTAPRPLTQPLARPPDTRTPTSSQPPRTPAAMQLQTQQRQR